MEVEFFVGAGWVMPDRRRLLGIQYIIYDCFDKFSKMDPASHHLPKRRTMVKDRVGCVRTSTYALPSEPSHVYGLKREPDAENAGDIISNWVVANPSEMNKTKNMTVYQNILAIKNGCVTSKSIRQFGKDHPNIRLKEQLFEDASGRNSSSHEGPFGIKTKLGDDSIRDILQGEYTDYFNDDSDYPDVSSIEVSALFPRPRPTASSVLLEQMRKSHSQEKETPKHFIMKKFRNIPGVIKTQPGK